MTDETKKFIAEVVQDHLVRYIAVMTDRDDAPVDVVSVEAHQTDWLNTQIRVKTVHGMPRYFNVKISESY